MEELWKQLNLSYKSKITGKLLGDGSIIKQKGRKPRFQFIHSLTDIGWAQYCYEELKSVLPLQPLYHRKNVDHRLNKGFSESVQCQSRTSSLISYLEIQWYKNRKKNIPFHLLAESLTLECLAWWYQDDGHLKVQNHLPIKIILSTDSFTNQENEQLIFLLKHKFNLSFTLDGKNRIALYNRRSVQYFLYLVSTFLHSSMTRKMKKTPSIFTSMQGKRTTLYLPHNIDMKQPSNYINHLLSHLQKIWLLCNSEQFYSLLYPTVIPKLEVTNPKHKSYQIKLTSINASYLYSLKKCTGLTYSELCYICLLIEKDPSHNMHKF